MTYIPSPQNIEQIELEKPMEELMEALAKDVHEQWAQTRISDGWQYGPERDDSKKLHPCLVPYEELPDSEKKYDRISAASTLKLIKKLGFDIVKREH